MEASRSLPDCGAFDALVEMETRRIASIAIIANRTLRKSVENDVEINTRLLLFWLWIYGSASFLNTQFFQFPDCSFRNERTRIGCVVDVSGFELPALDQFLGRHLGQPLKVDHAQVKLRAFIHRYVVCRQPRRVIENFLGLYRCFDETARVIGAFDRGKPCIDFFLVGNFLWLHSKQAIEFFHSEDTITRPLGFLPVKFRTFFHGEDDGDLLHRAGIIGAKWFSIRLLESCAQIALFAIEWHEASSSELADVAYRIIPADNLRGSGLKVSRRYRHVSGEAHASNRHRHACNRVHEGAYRLPQSAD